MAAGVTFDAATARRILNAVRRLERMPETTTGRPMKSPYMPGEQTITGLANGAATVDTLTTTTATHACTPHLPVGADDVAYVNTLGTVDDGASIVIAWEQRRQCWVLMSVGC